MREFMVASGDDGRRLEKWLLKAAPALSYAQACRFLRLKKVRVNGKVTKEGATLHAGDVVNAYLDDACFLARPRENKLLAGFRPRIDVLYEDENILLIDKRPGLRVHGDEEEKVDTLITHLQAYLYQKGEYDGTGFAPALCNRIDRFTGGIVIAAKNEAALKEMDARIRSRQVEKFYLCAVAGRMVPGAQAARTRYRTLATDGDLSLLECQLLTGRTHQIRAQFAAAGHPLIGDTQYGDPKINQAHASHFQQLYSYRIVFRFTGTPGPLEYLNGQSFQVKKLHRGFEEIVRRMPE